MTFELFTYVLSVPSCPFNSTTLLPACKVLLAVARLEPFRLRVRLELHCRLYARLLSPQPCVRVRFDAELLVVKLEYQELSICKSRYAFPVTLLPWTRVSTSVLEL